MHFFLREDANARVVMVARRSCRIQFPDGRIHDAVSRGKLFEEEGSAPVAGDEISAEEHHHQWAVERILPRKNEYIRLGQRKERQVMFANVDRVLVLASLAQPETKATSIDRFLVAALSAGIPAELILTKSDLDKSNRQLELISLYAPFNIQIREVSNKSGEGIVELRNVLSLGITALIGNSGVGKTSLLNNLIPGLNHKVAEVSTWSGKGVHTTTAAILIQHGEQAALIDTPGMKSFVPYGITEETVLGLFPEIGMFAAKCRFSDCAHRVEPDCAVREAVESERIPAARYISYQRIREGITSE